MKKKVTYTRDENLGVEIEGNILETNNAHGASPFDEKPKVTPEERKKIISFAVTAGISLLVVVIVLVIGAVFGNIMRKKDAAKDPRESTPTFYGALETEDWEDGKITSAVTQAYYTAENGMMVTIEFGNALNTDEHISKVAITLKNGKDVQIAKAQSASMKADFVVPAGGTNQITMYIKPEYVSVTDDSLETLKYEITIDYETRK